MSFQIRARRDDRAGGASSGSGEPVATGRLFLWSAARGEWVNCPPDEITWLDRRTLSGDEDVTLHRAPRCAGLRYVHHRWELFSRDTTYRVYLAPDAAGTPLTRRGRGADGAARAAGCPGPLRGAAGRARGGFVAGQRGSLGGAAATRDGGPPSPPSRRFLTWASR